LFSSQIGTKGQNQGRPQNMQANGPPGIGIVNELVQRGHFIVTKICRRFSGIASAVSTCFVEVGTSSFSASSPSRLLLFGLLGAAHFGRFPFLSFFAIELLQV